MSLASDIEPQPEHYSYIRKGKSYWTTKDGRKLLIRTIPDDHLISINNKFPSIESIKEEMIRRGFEPKKDYVLSKQYRYENWCNIWKD